MDLYITSLLLGAVGLGAMAVSGLGSHGHDGHAVHAGHGVHGHGAGDHGHTHDATQHQPSNGQSLLALMSPRLLFAFFLGFGTTGELLRPFVSGPLRFGLAIVGALLFELFIVSPLWNFTMRFASRPASTLESAVTDEATAVTAFDGNGQGIVSFEVDGQVVQILATLQPDDRLLGARVRAGQRLRIEHVDTATNRCTVSLL